MSGEDPGISGNKTVFRPSPLSGLGQATPAAPVEPSAAAAAAPPPRPSGPRLSDEGIPLPSTPRETRAPLVTEAGPLLALVASVRSGRARIAMSDFRRNANEALLGYDRAVAPLYPDETRRTARALLAATVDDIVANLPNLDGAEPWSGPPLSAEFGGDYDEERIWSALETALKEPDDNADLIELAHACLAAGYQGKFRTSGDGRAALSNWTTRLYGGLDHIKALSMRFVSPQWVGYDAPLGKVGLANIIALMIAAALVLILAVYAVLKLTGGGGATEVAWFDLAPAEAAVAFIEQGERA